MVIEEEVGEDLFIRSNITSNLSLLRNQSSSKKVLL